jgi:type III secretory pathway lipoprotein EscJ
MKAPFNGTVIKFFLIAAMTMLFGCREELLHDLNEIQANHVMVVLREGGIDAAKQRHGSAWTLVVSKDDVIHALQLLERRRTTRRELRTFSEQPRGILQSREERLQFIEHQSEWSIERTLESIPGVLEAHTHLFTPPSTDFDVPNSKAQMTASVLIITNNLSMMKHEELTSLVAGATGISVDKVNIVITEENEAKQLELNMQPVVVSSKPTEKQALGVIAACAVIGFLSLAARATWNTPKQNVHMLREERGGHEHVLFSGQEVF